MFSLPLASPPASRLGDYAYITSLRDIRCVFSGGMRRSTGIYIRRSRLTDKTTRLVGAWPIINWPLLIRTITPECRGNYQRGAGTASNKRTRLSRGWLTHRHRNFDEPFPSTFPTTYTSLHLHRVKRVRRAARNRERHVYRKLRNPPDNRRRVFPLGKIRFASGRDDCV